jgi:tetratricopeptide (TPR) repeat protein
MQKQNLSDNDIAKINYFRAKAYFNNGDYNKAEKIWSAALITFKFANDSNGIASCLNSLGRLEEIQGQYEIAIRYFQQALKIYEQINSGERLANSFNNIGNLYYNLGHYDKSLEYYHKSLQKCKELGNSDDINILKNKASAFNNIAAIYAAKSDQYAAISNFKEAESLFFQIDDHTALISVWLNTGNMYLELNKADSASIWFEKGLILADSLNNKYLYANALYFSSLVNIQLMEYENAEKKLYEALGIAENLQVMDLQRDIHYELYHLFNTRNIFEKALQNFKEYSEIKDSIISIEKHRQIQELLTKYETEKKDEEIKRTKIELKNNRLNLSKQRIVFTLISVIILLVSIFVILLFKSKAKRQLMQTEKDLTIYRQKALASQMHPHFVFNSLNSIQSYILKKDILKSNEYLTKLADLMRRTLNNSSEQFVPFEEELNCLKLYMDIENMRFEDSFDYKFEFDSKVQNEEIKIPTLLIQPFIENSIRHGFLDGAQKGQINISFEIISEKLIKSTIIDNGVGRKTSVTNIKSQFHVSKGTKLTSERIRLLGILEKVQCSIEFDDLKDKGNRSLGTKVTLIFPYKSLS